MASYPKVRRIEPVIRTCQWCGDAFDRSIAGPDYCCLGCKWSDQDQGSGTPHPLEMSMEQLIDLAERDNTG